MARMEPVGAFGAATSSASWALRTYERTGTTQTLTVGRDITGKSAFA
jgi:hypothetical protein